MKTKFCTINRKSHFITRSKKFDRRGINILLIFLIIFGITIHHNCYNNKVIENPSFEEREVNKTNNIFSRDHGIKQILSKSRKILPTKYILLWTKFCQNNWAPFNSLMYASRYKESSIGEDYFKENNCEYTNCVLTYNRSLLANVSNYDALIFHGPEGRDLFEPLPEYRSPHQIYIMGNLEPPGSFRGVSDIDLYNWTMTYKLNSDIVWPYSYIYDKKTNNITAPAINPNWKSYNDSFYDHDLINVIQKKSKMAVQFVSNCFPNSRRNELTKALSKYMSVDIYGKCGTLECSTDNNQCNDMFDNDYKFYFSFENALCEDYVTEKLFKTMSHTIIPVVYGGANYTRWAPPHSYIDINDFTTVEELATYLIFLSNNPEEYVKYFWWRNHYELGYKDKFCDVCIKLNKIEKYTEKIQYYHDILHWLYNDCHNNTKMIF